MIAYGLLGKEKNRLGMDVMERKTSVSMYLIMKKATKRFSR